MFKHVIVTLAILAFVILGCPSKNCDNYKKLPMDNTIAVLGDSVMAANSIDCHDVAREMGFTLLKQVHTFAVGGTCITCEEGNCKGDIPDQYPLAVAGVSSLQYVITDGGGNDIQFECKDSELPACTEDLNKLLPQLKAFLLSMKNDGKSVVYVGLYHPLGEYTKFNTAIDAIAVDMSAFCSTNNIEFVDLRPIFDGHPEYFMIDNMHPNATGSAKIAEAVLATIPVNATSKTKLMRMLKSVF